jgi:hypothetical protein
MGGAWGSLTKIFKKIRNGAKKVWNGIVKPVWNGGKVIGKPIAEAFGFGGIANTVEQIGDSIVKPIGDAVFNGSSMPKTFGNFGASVVKWKG